MTEEAPADRKAAPPQTHEFHAEAHVLSGELQRPIQQVIERHAPVALKDRRTGHLTRQIEDVSVEGLVTIKRGFTRVSGSISLKHGGWVTLSTSIVEGLNVFEVVTADRIVAQSASEHLPGETGHFPDVTFLGTQFTNLQINGFPLELTLNLNICGDERPKEGRSYLMDEDFLKKVQAQNNQIHSNIKDDKSFPENLRAEYASRVSSGQALLKAWNGKEADNRERKVTCSLVQSIDNVKELIEKTGLTGIRAFGHVLVIPEFGTVSLGEVEVGERWYPDSERPSNYFDLMAFKMNLGCVGHGSVNGGGAGTNGQTNP